MKLHWLTVILFVAACGVAMDAQVAIYGRFDATHISSSETEYEPTAWYVGPGAGIYYDFIHLGPLSAGLDLRGDLLFASQQKYRSALIGARVAIKAPVLPIKPYVQVSAGSGGAKSTAPSLLATHYNNKFQYQIAGGVDFTILPHIDFRVAELAYGRMAGISSGLPVPASNLFVASTGLVFRF
jgi:hypothetical protein